MVAQTTTNSKERGNTVLVSKGVRVDELRKQNTAERLVA
jgi:hypothetical protein